MNDEAVKKDQTGNTTYRVEDYFFVSDRIGSINLVLEQMKEVPGPLGKSGVVFGNSLMSTLLTACAFHVFARRRARESFINMMRAVIIGCETMKSKLQGTENNPSGEEVKEFLKRDLSGKWGEKLNAAMPDIAENYLQEFIGDWIGRDVASQIIKQCTVLVWTAFEVLASDVFIKLVNTNSGLAGVLLKDERTKKLYRPKELGDALEDYNYDLSRHMGEALEKQQRMDDLLTIKKVYCVLFNGSEDLHLGLNRPDLWQLYKMRNLIVHRGGVVDEQFRRDTASTLEVGTKLIIVAPDLEKFLIMVGEVGVELVRAASSYEGKSRD